MRRIDFLKYSTVVSASLALGGCAGQSSSAQPQDVQYFRYADNQPENYPTTQAGYRFSDLVRERTGGRIQIEVYPNAALGDETSVIEQVQFGMIDFARVSIGALSQYVPEMNVLQMPYLYTDAQQMWRVLDGEIGARFQADLTDYDLCGLSWFDAGARSFYANAHPITSLADMQGMIVRIQESDLMMDMIRALGAAPVEIVYRDVYSALQSGRIDAAENNFPSYESMSHYEVAKYFSDDQHMRVPEIQVASRTVLEGLSAEDQTVILEAAQESAVYERQLWTEREAASRETVVAAGTVINELSDEELVKFHDAVAPLYEQYCADYADIIAEIRNA